MSPKNRRSRRTSVEGRRSQRQTTFPPLSHDAININTNNPEQNISIHPPPIETLSPQLPPYGTTDGAQNNNKFSEMNQRHVVSSHENPPSSLSSSSLLSSEKSPSSLCGSVSLLQEFSSSKGSELKYKELQGALTCVLTSPISSTSEELKIRVVLLGETSVFETLTELIYHLC
ncbi:12106_t:CDS:2 [Ambispora gerdemannii]|uniref:12106_t:CDS:1 n=1 Tax=Ambispora gerdemannii TaxID=144530 RepID=A0A9N9A1W0_9GLOM|nr:12106_t:CDS:2 [Ambispora gerdemannii]